MSHFLEHLSFREMQRFLLECLRVLKSGAVISVAVPDAHLYVSAYLNAASVGPPPTTYEAAWHGTTAIDFLNYIGYMDGHHKHMFDADHLVHVLAAAGFRDVRLRPFDASLDLEERRLESVYAEALK
jgi:predicted SAM-dependent methyltransferase